MIATQKMRFDRIKKKDLFLINLGRFSQNFIRI